MSNIQYLSDLDIFVERPVPGQTQTKIEALLYFVDAFETGGSTGKITFKSAGESAIAAEFDRLRSHKKVALYLGSKVNLTPTGKLIDLSKSGIKSFTVAFRIKHYNKKEKKVVKIRAILAEGSFSETPIPVGGTPPYLKIQLTLTDVREFTAAGSELETLDPTYKRPILRRVGAEAQI